MRLQIAPVAVISVFIAVATLVVPLSFIEEQPWWSPVFFVGAVIVIVATSAWQHRLRKEGTPGQPTAQENRTSAAAGTCLALVIGLALAAFFFAASPDVRWLCLALGSLQLCAVGALLIYGFTLRHRST